MAKVPHHAGSAADASVAEYALGLFKEFGLDAHIENFEALIPYPTSRELEMVGPVKFRASLKEPAIAQDRLHFEPDSTARPTTPIRPPATSPRRWST